MSRLQASSYKWRSAFEAFPSVAALEPGESVVSADKREGRNVGVERVFVTEDTEDTEKEEEGSKLRA